MVFKFIKSQLIEVIEWTDDSTDTIVYRFPVKGNEIKMGAQLTVRESQTAVFVNEGQIADIFGPGRYKLSTENMPVLTKLKAWKYGFNSPFKAEVYFVNTKQFTNQKWGTSNPIMMRDPEFGMVRFRAFGIFSFKVEEPAVFLKEIFGTNRVFDTESIVSHLKRSLVSGIADLISESKIPVLDLAMHYNELGEAATEALQPRFSQLGLKLVSLFIENISLPEEVEKVLDKRTSMGVIGNMQQYTQYQTAEAIRDAAQNQGGGLAGAGVGLGAGVGIGQVMSQAFNQNMQSTPQPQGNEVTKVPCPKCGADNLPQAKFCSQCGTSMDIQKTKCIHCSVPIEKEAKFCPQCGKPQKLNCGNCGIELNPGAKFCPECGTKI
ncbi:SPFH domain-containing protein [Anaerobranca gottschalkii]|uniref:Membrane protease subunit, stomatin/prohibitin family, contains C-terminal Zn-ribbon domain n=1 Tax=Anaerobranca gottschalkii DSM 13577 TaxID=1120990 RepID=A0A1H9YKC9_9FIRM|nr:SPFH domain-containing protein [Anaerobranca gottschalkii]SES69059.1 Membrane protease subunit, stomatin/prohibitin family, contains C-terminal Zn-ribbon domain [Anaerobranca gottschalkii DSM 13577]